jgi:hypothetical protein
MSSELEKLESLLFKPAVESSKFDRRPSSKIHAKTLFGVHIANLNASVFLEIGDHSGLDSNL